MSDLREAAQQALEALEMSRRFVYADNRPQCDEAMDALRAALAQQDEPVKPAPLKRNITGRCTRKVCECEKEGLGPECIYLEPVDVGLLEYRGNSVAFIHQKMTAYRTGIDAAWDAFKAKGLHPDGKTSLADMIAKYTAPPQCPNCASLEAQNTELDRKLAELEQAYENGYKAGVAAEREECAKVCDFHVARLSAIDEPRPALAVGICAAAIRARGNT